MIIARTDAAGIHGIEEAIRRGHRYLEAGADMLFVEPTSSISDLELVANTFSGVPLVTKIVEIPGSPSVSTQELAQMGYKIILFPISLLLSSAHAILATLETIRKEGNTRSLSDRQLSYDQINERLGLPDWEQWEQRYKH